jgi:hypothetical protein
LKIIFGKEKSNNSFYILHKKLGFVLNRNIENRQEFDVCNRDSLRNECLFKLYLPMKTTIKEVIRLISERIEYSQQQIILQKPSK